MANSARVEAGLEPINIPLTLTTTTSTSSTPSAATNNDLPNYEGPSERLRIQAMIHHPDLYAKMNLHPKVRAADQEYLAKYLASKQPTESVSLDQFSGDEI